MAVRTKKWAAVAVLAALSALSMLGGPAAADDVADYTHAYQLTTQDNAAAAAQEAANMDLFAISCSVLEHVAVQPRSITIADLNTVHGFDRAEGSSLCVDLDKVTSGVGVPHTAYLAVTFEIYNSVTRAFEPDFSRECTRPDVRGAGAVNACIVERTFPDPGDARMKKIRRTRFDAGYIDHLGVRQAPQSTRYFGPTPPSVAAEITPDGVQ